MVTLSTNFRGPDLKPGDRVMCPFADGEYIVERALIATRAVIVRPVIGPGKRLTFKRVFLARIPGEELTPIERVTGR